MSYQVRILERDETFQVEQDESVLDAAFRAGIKMPHECQFGGCGTCRIKVVAGSVRYEDFPMGLTEQEHCQGYALACQARPATDLTISAAGKGLEFAEAQCVDVCVESIEHLSADIARLTLQLPAGPVLDYRPGQYMNILLENGVSRSFSMAAPARPGNLVDLHIRRIEGGYFTDRLLGRLLKGAAMRIEIPLGTFCFHEADWRPMVMMATGTGLAPIKAILESLLDNDDCPPVWLYWGMRSEEDLYLRDVIESWAGRLYEFNFVPVLSRASSLWQGRRGYVQQAVMQDFDDLSEHAIYLCGSPGMIADAKSLLPQRGANLDYMYSDSFIFQHQSLTAV